VAYTISGNHGIYHAQRILTSKHLQPASPLIGSSLQEIRAQRPPRGARVRSMVPVRHRRVRTEARDDPVQPDEAEAPS
jgi:hypothetical protein